jgi:3D (Asp-Asp-Asp) domain-containing protein
MIVRYILIGDFTMKSLLCLLMMSLFISTNVQASRKISSDPLERDQFNFPLPKSNEIIKKHSLWATYYYLPLLKDGSGPYPLRDLHGVEMGPRLKLREWCDAAMEGSVRVTFNDGISKTYNYAGVMDYENVDCSSIFRINVSKTKFREANGPYGDGIKNFILVPYRSIATDKAQIAPGTVLYIPEARGANITLSSGRIIKHDGYFFAADVGGAIKGNHIDVFIGTSKKADFFPWIKSTAEKTFSAVIINDSKISERLIALHLQ